MNAITQLPAAMQAQYPAECRVTEFGEYVVWHKSDEARITARNIELFSQMQGYRQDNDTLRQALREAQNEARIELAHISDLKAQLESLEAELDEARDEVRILVAEKKEAEHRQRKAESQAKQEAKRAETKAQRVTRQDKKIKQLNHQLTLAKQQAKKAETLEALAKELQKKVAQTATKHPSIKLAEGAIELQLAMNQVHIHKATEPQWLISSQQLNKEPDGAPVFGADSMNLVRKSCDNGTYKQVEQGVNQLARIWRKENNRLLTTDLEGPPKSALNKIWKAGYHHAKDLLLPEKVESIAGLPGIGESTMKKIKAALKSEGLL